MRTKATLALVGLLLGFSLSRAGFSSWDEIHSMFTFHDLRLLRTFLTGVLALAVAWAIVRRVSTPSWSQRPIHPGTFPGSLLFGLGWAISGACPAIALVQVGEGRMGGAFTLTGILAGNWLYAAVHERFFRWTPGSCTDK